MAGSRKRKQAEETGQLRIGDTWNAITIIALSQNNPLKAIAEFVENSIDAGAREIVITRGREDGQSYLRVKDDGAGIACDAAGVPDFKHVATHICDSIKKELKDKGATGIQGEFGIGLLSFWTVGEELTLTCAGSDGHTHQMRMRKGEPDYVVSRRRLLFQDKGLELEICPLLPGIRQLSGDKIQWYLASELRDRIRQSGVTIRVLDRTARKEFLVEPRRYSGRLLHGLPKISTVLGDVYVELYIAEQSPERQVALCRSGTRVLESVARLERLAGEPWTSGCVEGLIDVPFLHLTPGTRDGIIHDEALTVFQEAIDPLEEELRRIVKEQHDAEEQRASKNVLRSVQRALREALLALPSDEYDWFDVRASRPGTPVSAAAPIPGGSEPSAGVSGGEPDGLGESGVADSEGGEGDRSGEEVQKQFFEYEGPLFSVRLSPASCVVPVGGERGLLALARDRKRNRVERNVKFAWRIVEGAGSLSGSDSECATFTAPDEPCLTRVEVKARQDGIECAAEGMITVTDSLIPEARTESGTRKGLPGYTFHRAAGELWRSRYDGERNVVVINNGHRDFVYASRNNTRKLRYICRLFAKELVIKNFPGMSPQELLERMVELSLYTEENLK